MPDFEHTMLVFLRLAELSRDKCQLDSRDRFLLLAAIASCRGGCLDVAERCRTIVINRNPSHLIGGYPSLPDALRDPDFQPFQLMLTRFCSFERAELLLERNGGTRVINGQTNLQAIGDLLTAMEEPVE